MVFSDPNVLFTFAPAFKLKVFFICYEDTLLFMINNPDKDSKKPNCFLLSISEEDFEGLFWEKQSLFIMTFITSNFFQNNSGHDARLSSCWLSQPTSQECSESDLSLRLCC